ncbi:MAG: hypothetical protein A4E36_00763 [Methanoregulaceae archaeon PtaB.Bin009]|nr:MAG: hypothetical protein A4E36_00763 [Methanoregulaceae archaeon PtaB.Bin009]OPY39420.1 MAG: hypothetical protein A4E41_01763 [Methanoregulaceae archaeon PtaU1.Bin066]
MGCPDDTDYVPQFGSDYLHSRIVMVDFWQLFAGNSVERIKFPDFIFTHNLVIRNHYMVQYIQF